MKLFLELRVLADHDNYHEEPVAVDLAGARIPNPFGKPEGGGNGDHGS